MSSNKNNNTLLSADFYEVWDRLIEVTDIKYLKDLALIVGVSQQFISMRRKENLFPYAWAYPVAKKYLLLTEWVLTGKGPRKLSDIQCNTDTAYPILSEIEQWLNELSQKNPDRNRNEWFTIQMEDKHPDFLEWKKRREQEESEGDNVPSKKVA